VSRLSFGSRSYQQDGAWENPAHILVNKMPLTVEEIVQGGLCIGCGLCQAIAGRECIQLVLTPEGRERPVVRAALDTASLIMINAVCPGTRVEGAQPGTTSPEAKLDLIWGPAERLAIGYASDAVVRHRGSTGGVLTALGQFLLSSGKVKFILHVAASRLEPMRTQRRLSFDSAAVQQHP
jgi:coenzyme F420 hydrogenase subunit beta